MKLQLPLLLFASSILLFSCQKDAVSSNELITSFSANRINDNNNNEVPFKANYVTVHTLLQGPAVQLVNGTGVASHLGKSSFIANANVNFSTAPPFAIAGTATFKAANGDQFYTQFTGSFTPATAGPSLSIINHVITGGNGRFENATGAFTATSVSTSVPLTNNVTMEGAISY